MSAVAGDIRDVRTACARGVIRAGMVGTTGVVLTGFALAERVGWCADLVASLTGNLMADHWNASDVDVLASGVDGLGRRLPSHAWMALRRLAWTAGCAEGVKVNDRIVRMAQEQAGRGLRSVKWRADVVAGIVATWPVDPAKRTPAEWDRVHAAIAGGQYLPSAVIRSRTRHIAAFTRRHGRLPLDLFDMEPVPRMASILILAACDAQQATIERSATDPTRALLRLQLPTRPDPRSYQDWAWVACPITLPPTIPADAKLHLPTLRITDGKVRADLAYSHPVPRTRRTGHTVALGVDWGLNTLLSAGAARLHPDAKITTLGAGGQFRAAGVLAKQHRLRQQSERLHAKTDHYARLADPVLDAKAARLATEIEYVSERRRNLNSALAWAAARWTVDQAIAAEATVIYLEDLRSMEARGRGAANNTRLSQTVRGKIVDRVRLLAAEVGIAVVTVPARDTSKHCPHCLIPLRHCKAPNRPATPGWKWATCPNAGCGWQGDRDHGAWQRIAARGLAHQTQTTTGTPNGGMTIRTVTDAMEAKAVITAVPATRTDRSKTGPTPHKATHPTPRRREVPSPPRLRRSRTGQRPEGHAPTGRRLPRAAQRYQGVTTTSTPTITHQPRGAALGAGFHRHAHATPPRWQAILGDPTRITQDQDADLRRWAHGLR